MKLTTILGALTMFFIIFPFLLLFYASLFDPSDKTIGIFKKIGFVSLCLYAISHIVFWAACFT